MSDVRNLFRDIPDALPAELFETLLEGETFKLERIVSLGHATPEGQWYDQARDEWVALLCGAAKLEFEDKRELVALNPGDFMLLPARRRHRVAWTDPDQPTVWLALHYNPIRGRRCSPDKGETK